MPYISRNVELYEAVKFIENGIDQNENYIRRQISIIGPSGVGKTRFVKEVVNEIYNKIENSSQLNCIYLDTFTNTNDLFISDLFFRFMIGSTWMEKEYNFEDITCLSNKSSFRYFLKNRENSNSTKNAIYSALRNSIGFIPAVGDMFKSILPEELTDTTNSDNFEVDFSLLFHEYLNNITKKNKLIFIVDNFQFIDQECKLKLKTVLKNIKQNIIFIPIIRENDLFKLNINEIKRDSYYEELSRAIVLKGFELAEVSDLINATVSNKSKINHDLISDCYNQTKGNLKEIEQFLFNINNMDDIYENLSDFSFSSPLLSNVYKLSEVRRDILFLVSLFPTGIKLDYVQKIIEELLSLGTNVSLASDLEFLVNYNLITIGSEDDFLKPAHEKVIVTVGELSSDICNEEFLNLRNTCIDVFSTLASRTHNNSDFIFLVNSLLGIQKVGELKRNIALIFRYVDLLHKLSQYKEIVRFYDQIMNDNYHGKELLFYLPLNSINLVLDCFQKTSNFNKGLDLIKLINQRYNTNIFEAKYSLQLYQYEKAIDSLKDRLDDPEYLCAYLNALQHLRKDHEVRKIINDLHEKGYDYENEYLVVILRNSAHLFDFVTAETNLLHCLKFFKENEMVFGEATTLNNLGLVYLSENKYGTALKFFEQSQELFSQIYSNEVYQPTFNSGLVHLIKNEYCVASERIKNALNFVPGALSFDKIKFENNLILCEFLMGEKDIDTVLQIFPRLFSKASLIPDPWLAFLLKLNWARLLTIKDQQRGKKLESEALEQYKGDKSVYGHYHSFSYNQNNIEFLLATSPHWRY